MSASTHESFDSENVGDINMPSSIEGSRCVSRRYVAKKLSLAF